MFDDAQKRADEFLKRLGQVNAMPQRTERLAQGVTDDQAAKPREQAQAQQLGQRLRDQVGVGKGPQQGGKP